MTYPSSSEVAARTNGANARQPLSVVYRPISELRPDPKNPRSHSPKQVRQIANSISAFGFNVPVLVDSNLTVVAGHGRLEKILMETLMDPVTVTEHGKTRQITKMAAMFKQLINKAANGNMPSIKLAVLLLERMPQVANAEAEAEDRAKVLAQVREKVRRRLDNMSKAFEEETAREAMKGQGRDDQIIGGAGNQGSVSN